MTLVLRHLRTILLVRLGTILSAGIRAIRCPCLLSLVVLCAEVGSREIRIVTGIVEIVRAVVVAVYVVAICVVRIDVVPVHVVNVPVVVVIAVDERVGIGDVNVSIVNNR